MLTCHCLCFVSCLVQIIRRQLLLSRCLTIQYSMLHMNLARAAAQYATSTQLKLNSAAGRSALINYYAAGKFITTNNVSNNGSSECLATLSSSSASLNRNCSAVALKTIACKLHRSQSGARCARVVRTCIFSI